jgi:DNA ligase-1
VLLADVVATSDAIAATRARSAKVEALAGLLARVEPDEIEAVVGFLSGEVRQGRIGIGWATVASIDAAPAATPSLTVVGVDGTLDALATTAGPGSTERRAGLLRSLFEQATAEEGRFLGRLLTGELRQGALEGLMTDAIAKAAAVPAAAVRRALMLGGELGATARAALLGGSDALEAVQLQVLRPLRPMLASTAESVAEALASVGGAASVEWKLDGARIQVHRAGDQVRVFTRNLNDVTSRLPEVVEVVRGLPAERLVLDGETLTMAEDGRPRAFQDTMSRFGADAARIDLLRPFFFDALHVDGLDLVDLPLVDRLMMLDQVAGPWRIPSVVTSDQEVGAAFADGSLAEGHEGVMVKAASSRYEAGRRGKAWLKVKPVRTLDLVVLGAEWGHGRRHGWLSNLHLGARDPDGGFVMVGKTFKGLTDALLAWQTERFLELEERRDGIVVFVRPEQVVEIALDGAQVSPRYPGGVALRFARVVRYRDDKDPAEADTIEMVQALLPGAGSVADVEADVDGRAADEP